MAKLKVPDVNPIVKHFVPTVSSHGYGDANIMFLLGAPSKDDLINGVALSGYSESLITSFLRDARYPTRQIYKSCFIKQKMEYSGTNPKKLRRALAAVDTDKYLDLLFEEIKDVNPNVIVPLDDLALSAVFPHINQIKKPKGRMYWVDCYRGSVLSLRSDFQSRLPNIIRVIPTLGPQHLNQDYAARAYVQIDFNRIVENHQKRSPIQEYGLIWVAKTYQSLYNFFERGLAKNDGFVTSDIESFCGLITCISYCFDGYEAVSVPLNPYFYKDISLGELGLMWQLCAKLESHELAKAGQNYKFDWTIKERHGMRLVNVKHDTMIKMALLYPELPKGLDFITSIYTPIPYYKDEGKNYDPTKDSKERLLLYNAKDSLATHIANREMDKELEENGQSNLYFNEIAPSILIYKNMDETGILVDDEQRHRLLFKYHSMAQQNLSILRGLVNNQGYNPNSPIQVGKLIYEELKFPKRMKTDPITGIKRYKTDKETLDELNIQFGASGNKLGKLGVQILARQILARKLALIIQYIKTPLHADGTFRGVSNLGGTETGRTSFSKSLDERFFTEDEIAERKANKKNFKTQLRLGRSLQTITKHGFDIDDDLFDDPESGTIAKDLRSMFVPRRGYVFIEGDGSAAEARMVAVLAEDWELLESFDKKPKIHAKTAALCFGGDPNQIGSEGPKHPAIGVAYYDLGKRIRHAGHYDMTEFRLAQMTHLSLAEAKVLLFKFHGGNPKIKEIFHRDINDFVNRNHYLETPFRRKRQFFDRPSNHQSKQAKAQIPQSTISDQTKFSMHRIVDQCRFGEYMIDYRFLTEQHDGILSEVKKEIAEPYMHLFKKVYERPIDCRVGSLSRDIDLVIPAEISMSDTNWMSLKEIKGL